MIVPHLPPPEKYTQTTKRDHTLNDEQFFQDALSAASAITSENSSHERDSTHIARQLRDERDYFARQVEVGNNSAICCAEERAAVITIYNEAIEKIAKWDAHHSNFQVKSSGGIPVPEKEYAGKYTFLTHEVQTKTRIIIGITHADPDDSVFSNNLLLKPLEPHYATPRIDMHEDNMRHRAAWRLKAWRTEGWPDKYPADAVALEAKRDRRVSRSIKGYHETYDTVDEWSIEDWGEEVDAAPGHWTGADWNRRQGQKKHHGKEGGGC
ncbi:hypothetical protein T440DRAFT_409531 [Plenodomus tracheiphilus IPT5]|uniref:Uncharacterized protein n=1 Tax=Plenodomus tracheiphilus IPT5 TaxID=1408161 RepID=A0A6A7APU6_9PLEO|nr:hypothetical protein T440DRAFT_409531 [Plenodomus tracheiphilus IPT5]